MSNLVRYPIPSDQFDFSRLPQPEIITVGVVTNPDATATPTTVAALATVGAPAVTDSAAVVAWTGEGGTNTTGITTGNSGGASGDAFDSVTLGVGASAIYDNTQARGSLAAKLATGGTAADCSLDYSTKVGSRGQVWFRAYLYIGSNPATNHRLIDAWDSGSGQLCFAVYLTTAGKLMSTDTLGGTIQTSTASIPLNSWFRIEVMMLGSATVGQVEIKLFNSPDSTSVTETLTSTATQNTRGTANNFRFGSSGDPMPASRALWLDNLGIGVSGYLGPAAGTAATATPGTVAAVAGVGATGAVTGSTVTPATVAATAGVGAPTGQAGANPTPSTVAAVAAVGAAVPAAGASVTPATVTAVAGVGAATVIVPAIPGTVAAVATIPVPTGAGGAAANPATVAAIAGVGAAVLAAGAKPTPAVVAAVAAVGAPTILASATLTPAVVAATAAVGTTTPRAGAVATPTTVAAVAAVATPTVDIVPPTVPTNLAVTATTEGTLDLSWTASTDTSGLVTQYEVRVIAGPPVDPRGTPLTLPTSSLPIKGAQIGAWDMDGGLLTSNSGARTLTQQAGTKLVRWQMWRTPCDIRGTACQTTSDVLTGLDTCRKLATGNNALLLVSLPPIWNEQYPGQPDPWTYAWQQFVIDKVMTFLGPSAYGDVLFEMGNEPDNYGGLTGQQYYDTLWAPNVPALKAYARYTYGTDIRIGGPAWANSYTADLTSIGTWMTACKTGYTANGNNRDYLPDFVSTHTYLVTPTENDTLAHALTRIDAWGVFYRQLRTNIDTTFAGVADRGYPVARQIKVINSEYNYTIDNANTQDSDQGWTDHYMRAMHAMFKASGLWATVEFTVASHTGGALDLLTTGGAAKPLYYSYAAQ